MKYRIIAANNLQKLEEMVNVEIGHNWTPQGNPFVFMERVTDKLVALESGNPVMQLQQFFGQALVRSEVDKGEPR